MSESTLVKMPYCWKSHVVAQFLCCGYSKEPSQRDGSFELPNTCVLRLMNQNIFTHFMLKNLFYLELAVSYKMLDLLKEAFILP